MCSVCEVLDKDIKTDELTNKFILDHDDHICMYTIKYDRNGLLLALQTFEPLRTIKGTIRHEEVTLVACHVKRSWHSMTETTHMWDHRLSTLSHTLWWDRGRILIKT